LQPTSGRILFGGRDVAGVPSGARQVAQVFQFPVLYPRMTVLENLTFPLRNSGWKKADAAARALEIARELGIESTLASGVAALTLFERQLVAIGRALVRPDVALVLLDEPLTAVQPELKWRLRRALRKVQSDLGVTMIYVTHDQTEALTFARAVSVMQGGRILQTGSPREVHDLPDHEYVGFFIGSPGMNFLDAEVRDGKIRIDGVVVAVTTAADGPYSVGFRADWATLASAGLPVKLLGFRPDAVQNDLPVGVAVLERGQRQIHVRAEGRIDPGQAWLRLDHHLLFREGRRVA
jgi:glycerol transport system ATP-binding protein